MRLLFTRRRLLVLGTCTALACFVAVETRADDDAGYESLFDGKTLENWDGNPKFWSVEDGCITGHTTKENPTSGNTFLIYRKSPFGDFELKLEYKIVGGNSGIQYRSKESDKWVIGGYQADFEAGDGFTGINYEERGRGILAQREQKVEIAEDGKKTESKIGDGAELGKVVKKEEWNTYEVSAQGNHLIHKINGKVMSEVVDSEKGKSAATGLLALQLHAGPPMKVQFKNVKIKVKK